MKHTINYYKHNINYYKKAASGTSFLAPTFANNFYKKGFYSEALYYFNAICKLDSSFCNNKIRRSIKSCKFSINSMNNPVVFNPINIGDNINSNMSEIGPAISSDDNKIVFTRRVEDTDSNPQEDFYY